ncbi:MAG: DUF2892 domain-containing protein [Salinibacter sp.]
MPTTDTEPDDTLQVCRVPTFEENLAGVVSLTGLGLGYFVSEWWYLLTVFAGLNILQSAFTGFCPPEIVYRWFKR